MGWITGGMTAVLVAAISVISAACHYLILRAFRTERRHLACDHATHMTELNQAATTHQTGFSTLLRLKARLDVAQMTRDEPAAKEVLLELALLEDTGIPVQIGTRA